MPRSFALIIALCVSSALPAAEFDPKPIDDLASKALKSFEAPGLAIVIVKDDKVIYLQGHGVREVGTDLKVTPDTLFAIASCSKAFTAAAVGLMVEDGKMKWDDPLGKHLPGFKMNDVLADREVTVRDSLCHRHGLARHDVLWMKTDFTREEILKRIAHLPRSTSFRSTFEYNNLLFLAAGEAAGKANGTSFEEIVQKRIFTPLGMKTACFSTTVALKNADHAKPHRRDDDRKVIAFPWDNIDHIGPAGAINASVRDLSQWLRVQLNGGHVETKRILAPSTIKEMHTPQTVVRLEGRWPITFPTEVTNLASYGLGWFITDYRGRLCVSHGGTLEGFRAQTLLFPKEKFGVVVLANLGGNRLPESLSKSICDVLLDLPEKERKDWNAHYLASDSKTTATEKADKAKRLAERKKDTKPSLALAEYAGKFNDAGYGDVAVTFEKDELRLKWASHDVKLEHFHFDTFTMRNGYRGWPDDRVVFRLNAAGKVEGLLLLGREFAKR